MDFQSRDKNSTVHVVLAVVLGLLIGVALWKWSRAGMTIEFGGSYCDNSIAHYVDWASDLKKSPAYNVNPASKALPLNAAKNMDLYDTNPYYDGQSEMDY